MYVDAVMAFLNGEAKGKEVLEIGSGTGRITERLVRQARKVVSVDVCERMIQRSKNRLGDKTGKVKFLCELAQDHQARERSYALAICSLVLIHNVGDSDFRNLVEMMCRCADKIFVFEDASGRHGTSPHTRLRNRQELITPFQEGGFQLEKEDQFHLFGDTILFLKFVRLGIGAKPFTDSHADE